MTDKQIIIDELKNEIACKENIINHLAEHNIKLQVQFKEKEQECEYWKHQAELGLDTTDKLAKELEETKETIDDLLSVQYKLADNNKQLRQTLAEIKKLVEKEFCRHPECCEFCAISNECVNQKIIEKINEVEDDKSNN